MRMTRQHFALIAEVLSEARRDYGETIPMNELVKRFADALRRTNPQFSRDRFERASE